MEHIQLINELVPVSIFKNAQTFAKLENIPVSETEICENSPNSELRQSILTALETHQAKYGRSLCIHLKKGSESGSPQNVCVLRVHGFIWEHIDSLCVGGVKLRLELEFVCKRSGILYYSSLGMLRSDISIASLQLTNSGRVDRDLDNEVCLQEPHFCEIKNVPIQWQPLLSIGSGQRGESLHAYVKAALISNDEGHGNNADLRRRVPESESQPNFKIVACDGTPFHCHRAVLAGASKVFETMLDSAMMEAEMGQLELERTPGGVKVLLDFLYNGDVIKTLEDDGIILDLLQAGCMYQIKSLELELRSVIMAKPCTWFTVNVAFGIFLSTRLIHNMKGVNKKAVKTLRQKPGDLAECEIYKQEFAKNPVQTIFAVRELICIIIKGSKWFNDVSVAFQRFLPLKTGVAKLTLAIFIHGIRHFHKEVEELLGLTIRQEELCNMDTAFTALITARKENNEKNMSKALAFIISAPDKFLICENVENECRLNADEAAEAVLDLFCMVAKI